MGIVVVAFLPASIRGDKWEDKNIDLEWHEFGYDGWDSFELALGAAIFNKEVFPLGITELPQPLPQGLDIRPRIGRVEGSRYVADGRNPCRLLRLGGRRGR